MQRPFKIVHWPNLLLLFAIVQSISIDVFNKKQSIVGTFDPVPNHFKNDFVAFDSAFYEHVREMFDD
jgi:hypothetical protein